MTNNMIIKKSKAMLGKREITVTEYFPNGKETMDMIANGLTEFYLENLSKFYTNEELEILLPVFHPLILKDRKLKKQNYTDEQIKEIILNEFQKEMAKKSEAEQENINRVIYETHQRSLIEEVMNNGK